MEAVEALLGCSPSGAIETYWQLAPRARLALLLTLLRMTVAMMYNRILKGLREISNCFLYISFALHIEFVHIVDDIELVCLACLLNLSIKTEIDVVAFNH